MKKVLFLMVCVLALTSCKIELGNMGENLIEASDNIVTKSYKLTAFEEVDMTCVGDVEIIQDEQKSGTVTLTAPDNYIDLYQFTSDHSRLTIGWTKRGVNIHTAHVKIKVYTSDLVRIHNSGASHISMNKLDTDCLQVVNSGVGSIDVAGIADEVDLRNSGVGSINTQQLKALRAKASVSGVGSIKCYASESIEGRVSGVGSLEYAGHPRKQDNKRSGVGSIKAI